MNESTSLEEMMEELARRLRDAEAKEGLSETDKGRIREALELAAMMEETIEAALGGKEETAPEETLAGLTELEYTAHTIGTPEEEGPKDIEDIALDAGDPEPEGGAAEDESEEPEDEETEDFIEGPIEHGTLLAASLALEKKAEEAIREQREAKKAKKDKKDKKKKDKKKGKKDKKKDKK